MKKWPWESPWGSLGAAQGPRSGTWSREGLRWGNGQAVWLLFTEAAGDHWYYYEWTLSVQGCSILFLHGSVSVLLVACFLVRWPGGDAVLVGRRWMLVRVGDGSAVLRAGVDQLVRQD